MNIHLRKNGKKYPEMTIGGVVYFEPFFCGKSGSYILFRRDGRDDLETIEVDALGNFKLDGKTFDFCEMHKEKKNVR